MKAKIDWYKEVLELEPGSRVFFPLARLLAENGQLQEAVSTLRLGLERHPEFVEARLYLIELLHENEDIEQCGPQVGQLAKMFSRYPGVWEAWGTCSSNAGKEKDLALILRLLAFFFKNPNATLAQVLEQGLRTMAVPPSLPANDTLAVVEMAAEDKPASILALEEDAGELAADSTDADFASLPVLSLDEENAEEAFSLRTRSMAELLASQGDIAGALDIYRELLLTTQSAEEREELESRIARLSSPTSLSPETPCTAQSTSAPGNKQRMQHLLESLAGRLEARAAG